VTYSRSPLNPKQWILYDGEKVVERAAEGADIACMAFIMLFKTCTEDVYTRTKIESSIRLLDAKKAVLQSIRILAALHKPQDINIFKDSIVRNHLIQAFPGKERDHLYVRTSGTRFDLTALGKTFFDEVTLAPFFENGNSQSKLSTWISEGTSFLIAELKNIIEIDSTMLFLHQATRSAIIQSFIAKKFLNKAAYVPNNITDTSILSLISDLYPNRGGGVTSSVSFCTCGVMIEISSDKCSFCLNEI
jgi:hypothetical protein